MPAWLNHLARGDLDAALAAFLALWRPPPRGPRSIPDVVPRPLRRLYELTDAARLATQNRLVAADTLAVDAHRKLMFYVENQGVCRWATEVGDDPPVWIAWDWSDTAASWQPDVPVLRERAGDRVLVAGRSDVAGRRSARPGCAGCVSGALG
ncbi:MAG: hypothetical protein K8W52_19395 [Deltaproteobacteria bacterium]|nr:hypothetical protein [Deltaproteobacteria bacterium]